MATVRMHRRLANPRRRRRRRNMTAKQIKYFGTKAQKNALRRRRNLGFGSYGKPISARRKKRIRRSGKLKLKNRGYGSVRKTKRRRKAVGEWTSLYGGFLKRKARRTKARRRRGNPRRTGRIGRRGRGPRVGNVGEILTITLPNSGRRRSGMARTRRRGVAARRRRRRNAPVYRARRTYNRRRRGTYARRRRNRGRRNQGFRVGGLMTGTTGTILGLLSGATVTKLLVDMLPPQFKTNILGLVSTGVVATVQGQMAGRFLRNRGFGNNMTMGGMVLLAFQVLQTYFPNLLAMTPFGLRGMGMLAPSNFYTPQVNLPGSMSRFVTPAAAAVASVPAAGAGMGLIGRRTARLGRAY